MGMEQLPVLRFIGGPFDGFRQTVSATDSELPPCVALPLNREAGRLMGFRGRKSDANRVAVYRLKTSGQDLSYHFHRMRVLEEAGTTERGNQQF
jgi:hypothetical protein